MRNLFVQIRSYLAGSIWRKRVLFSLIGALGGYAYYYFIGCASGACPISSNPYISTAYGAGMGLILTIAERKKTQQETDNK
jgi:hypothetical protein